MLCCGGAETKRVYDVNRALEQIRSKDDMQATLNLHSCKKIYDGYGRWKTLEPKIGGGTKAVSHMSYLENTDIKVLLKTKYEKDIEIDKLEHDYLAKYTYLYMLMKNHYDMKTNTRDAFQTEFQKIGINVPPDGYIG